MMEGGGGDLTRSHCRAKAFTQMSLIASPTTHAHTHTLTNVQHSNFNICLPYIPICVPLCTGRKYALQILIVVQKDFAIRDS